MTSKGPQPGAAAEYGNLGKACDEDEVIYGSYFVDMLYKQVEMYEDHDQRLRFA